MVLNALRSKFPVDGDQGRAMTLLVWCKVIIEVIALAPETSGSIAHYRRFDMAGFCFARIRLDMDCLSMLFLLWVSLSEMYQ